MPIKFPKAFPRRKSSGNILDDVDDHPEAQPVHEGFRLLSRDEATKLSAAKKPAPPERAKFSRLSTGRPFTSPHKAQDGALEEDLGKNHRSSVYETSSSSARFSSTSTLPSAADADVWHENGENLTNGKADPRHFSLKGAARNLTGNMKQHKPNYPPRPVVEPDEGNGGNQRLRRDRASTTSTYASTYASTAVPPKIDSNLSLEASDFGDDLGDLFGGFGSDQPSVVEEGDSEPPSVLPVPPKTFASQRSSTPPHPILLDKFREIDPPPRSLDSHASNDALISPSLSERSLAHKHAVSASSSIQVNLSEPSIAKVREKATSCTPHDAPGNLRFNEAPRSAIEDEDAKIIMRSFRLSRATGDQTRNSQRTSDVFPSDSSLQPADSPPTAFQLDRNDDQTPGVTNGTPAGVPNSYPPSTPQASKKRNTVSVASATIATSGSQPDELSHAPVPSVNKRMTARQFSQYRRQKESQQHPDSFSDDEDSDASYEDDEADRLKEAQKQRARQQANLSILRQQMQRISGGPATSNHPDTERLNSTSRLSLAPPAPVGDPVAHSYSGGDPVHTPDESSSDEDIPLGILKAHDFPKKNKEPSKTPGSVPGYIDRPFSADPSTRFSGRQNLETPLANNRASILPPFARNLPADPYFGAGLVAPANRESLGFGSPSSNSVYGAPASTAASPYGGLIGVIDSEQRAKAARRATPNPMLPQTMPMMGAPQLHPSNPMDYMAQMMASMTMMQQQLMNMQQQHMASPAMAPMSMQPPLTMPGSLPPGPGHFLSPPNANPMTRPLSMTSNSPVANQQRAMSMVNLPGQWPMTASSTPYTPSVRGMPGGATSTAPGYAPSLAPSERSNVGMAPRYRPVTAHHPDGNSTVSSKTVQPGTLSTNTLPSKVHGFVKTQNSGPSEEEDEEEWSNMKNRKSRWIQSKTTASSSTLKDLYLDGM